MTEVVDVRKCFSMPRAPFAARDAVITAFAD